MLFRRELSRGKKIILAEKHFRMETIDKATELLQKLEKLTTQQTALALETNKLRFEIEQFKKIEIQKPIATAPVPMPVKPIVELVEKQPEKTAIVHIALQTESANFNYEKFIGENLLSKIGIIITVIGVSIGVKYSIENQLISPLTRIILGYIFGGALMGLGFKLKEKYTTYSAVLVSGSIALLYFISYVAYVYYALFPQTIAFLLMVLFTVFAVYVALTYKQQIIALFGLVGAYAIPFLLSDGSGNVLILFSYVLIINIGILLVAFQKYWKIVHYAAFIITWLVVLSWRFSSYNSKEHFWIALLFCTAFMLLFYGILLAYKLIKKEIFATIDIVFLFWNAFIYYSICYFTINTNDSFEKYLGAFTLLIGLLNLSFARWIQKQKTYDSQLYYAIITLAIVFFTLAIPVQLDGNWVTLFWIFQATLLFSFGRLKNIYFYEKFAIPVFFLALFSLLDGWNQSYSLYNINYQLFLSVFNIHFLTSVLFIFALATIVYINFKHKKPTNGNHISILYNQVFPVVLGVIIFVSLWLEIDYYWEKLYVASEQKVINFEGMFNQNFKHLKTVWLINYGIGFSIFMQFLHQKKFKNYTFQSIGFLVGIVFLTGFLLFGLHSLSYLANAYYTNVPAVFKTSFLYVFFRYFSLVIVALFLYQLFKGIYQENIYFKFKIWYDGLLSITLLWLFSSELFYWLERTHAPQTNKLGLTVLWGVFALFLISYGIFKAKKHLRIGAIVLLAITLLKLFLYDISHLDTLRKTIILVLLGIVFLIISFIYNKFKHTFLE